MASDAPAAGGEWEVSMLLVAHRMALVSMLLTAGLLLLTAILRMTPCFASSMNPALTSTGKSPKNTPVRLTACDLAPSGTVPELSEACIPSRSVTAFTAAWRDSKPSEYFFTTSDFSPKPSHRERN